MNTLKWHSILAVAILAAIPLNTHAQINIPIGAITAVADTAPTTWGMSGMEMVQVTRTIGTVTPIMRTMTWDARTVEILSRTQAPRLRARDIKRLSRNGREIIVVRRFLLMEVLPEDAAAAGMSKAALAEKWVKSIRTVLPQVAPTPSRFGV